MERSALVELMQLAFWLPLFVAIFLPIFAYKVTRKEPYLKRVAKKYSISPLDLR
jgi:hypothetical protein